MNAAIEELVVRDGPKTNPDETFKTRTTQLARIYQAIGLNSKEARRAASCDLASLFESEDLESTEQLVSHPSC
jgi:hypothetical protein